MLRFHIYNSGTSLFSAFTMSRITIPIRRLTTVMRPVECRLAIPFQPERRLGKTNYSSPSWICRNGFELGFPRFSQPSRGLVNIPLRVQKMPVEYPLLTGSEHWKRKMRSVFMSLDSNKDGILSRKDMVLSAKRSIQHLNLKEDKLKDVLKLRLYIWETSMGKNAKGEIAEEISFEEFVQNRILAFNDMQARQEIMAHIISVEFNTMDTDGDGLISSKEHAIFCESLNIPPDQSKKIFALIDSNKDGLITMEEFGQSLCDFWLGE
ncbi:sarcoplasmic calcium-binding protein-like [Lingula anatina]|uniref:Sarcoplasmic calcium-binding protein-like n=1 Tax=Lingula anatina TaxID=7574 RepID=A0A1S3ILL6_LINAN|nr:sarcoplasmic calcium-binding protein-like [Lingula anatina]|eukprot:XP_013398786.1 sarcoplasmic calcium-binding protein-like [Lingula anatina]